MPPIALLVPIAASCVAVTRGGRMPFVVEYTSSEADVFGVTVPIPTALFTIKPLLGAAVFW